MTRAVLISGATGDTGRATVKESLALNLRLMPWCTAKGKPGAFSYDSPWYHITDGEVLPQPVQRPHPVIANAGNSEEARP
jgi:alkanesulfonate monooxygenase SsuD/methylene tetrahydromethanopterin reductase-like flavin-dependent oxidoreductase (luciferase family)